MNGPWPRGDPQAVVKSILADPRFRGTTTSEAARPDPLTLLVRWISERVGDLARAIGHLLGNATPYDGAIGIAVLAVVAVGILAFAIRLSMLPGRRYAAERVRVVTLDDAPASRALVALALAAAREERWYDAVSALARAAMRALDERGRLPYDPSRTPGEARRILHDAAFTAFEREATTALFAHGAATRERFVRMREAYAGAFGDPVA